jgi:hypothetical protein
MTASQTFASRTQSFAVCRLKSRAGEGFYLTLTLTSAKIRPLFTVVFSYISRDCGDGFVAGRRWRFWQIRSPRYRSQAVRLKFSAGENQWTRPAVAGNTVETRVPTSGLPQPTETTKQNGGDKHNV